jgi:catechol 2,3-dioxygenase-like lactoylglutathione lyase family enzyme
MVERSPRLTHVLLFVADLQRSRDFYLGTLGLEPFVEEEDYLRLTGLGVDLGLHRAHDREQYGGPGIELQLQVDDVDAWYQRLLARGARFTNAPEDMPWGARQAFLHDPDGYRLSLYTLGSDGNPNFQ